MLSPVSAASSISSVAATIRRPSAGILSPASKETTSPGTSSSAGMSVSSPPRRTCALISEHLLERGDALRRLPLLVQAEDRVEHGQADDHDPGAELLQRDDADDRGADEDELHQVAVLAQERPPAGLRLRLVELVRAVLRRRRSTSAASSPHAASTPSCAHASSGSQAVPRGRVLRNLDGRRHCHAASKSRTPRIPAATASACGGMDAYPPAACPRGRAWTRSQPRRPPRSRRRGGGSRADASRWAPSGSGSSSRPSSSSSRRSPTTATSGRSSRSSRGRGSSRSRRRPRSTWSRSRRRGWSRCRGCASGRR